MIEEGGPSDALIDVHFFIDTSGSMGAEVNAAKAADTSLFNEITGRFGDVAASVGVFSEGASLTDLDMRGCAIIGDLTTDTASFQTNVNQVTSSNPDGGRDIPESGYTGIVLAAENLTWRPGSNRFMFVSQTRLPKAPLPRRKRPLMTRTST